MKMFCMLLVVGIVCCYTSQTVDATEGPEVFDIKKGEVVLTLPIKILYKTKLKTGCLHL